jgi:hypothetical protein
MGTATEGVEQGDECLQLDPAVDCDVDIGIAWKESEKKGKMRIEWKKNTDKTKERGHPYGGKEQVRLPHYAGPEHHLYGKHFWTAEKFRPRLT